MSSFPKRIQLTPSVVALLLANAVVLGGVVFFKWQIFLIMLLFWSENVIIGFYTVLKMLWARPRDPAARVTKHFLIPFFAFHYGMFTMGHGIFVRSIFGQGEPKGGGLPAEVAEMWRIVLESGLAFALLAVVLSHGFSFVWNYLLTGQLCSRRSGYPRRRQDHPGRQDARARAREDLEGTASAVAEAGKRK